MNAIKLVSWVHLLWGFSMISFGLVPRPFGQLEAFLTFIDATGYSLVSLGVVFVASASLAIFSLNYAEWFENYTHVLPMTLMPQQLLLTIGVLYSSDLLLFHGFDLRIWYTLCPQLVFFSFHAKSIYALYKELLLKAKVKGKVNGKR